MSNRHYSDEVFHDGAIFYDRQKQQANQLYHSYHMYDRHGDLSHLSWFQRLELKYIRLRFQLSFYYDRFMKTKWEIIFTLLFVYFVYQRLLVDEREGYSNNTASMGAFISALLLLLSYLISENYLNFNKKDSSSQRKEKSSTRSSKQMKDNRPYVENRQLLNEMLRSSLRQALVSEQQKRITLQEGKKQR